MAPQGYFEDLVNGRGEQGEGGIRRDPKVAANWVSNNLFGLLKDQLGRDNGLDSSEEELERSELFSVDAFVE